MYRTFRTDDSVELEEVESDPVITRKRILIDTINRFDEIWKPTCKEHL